MVQRIKITTVTPVYAGEAYLEKLIGELVRVREKWKNSNIPLELAESIFVNDSAIDRSHEILKSFKNRYDWIHVLTLSRNFGQHPATIAGILHSCGDWVFTIDEDLQHDPKYFEQLLAHAVTKELDVVYVKPEGSVHQSLLRDQGSRLYKRLISKITGTPQIVSFNSYRLLRGTIARSSASVCSHETYFDVALCWFTDRLGCLPIPLKDQRFIEKKGSGYNLWKLFSHARRLLISAPAKFLRAGAIFGLMALIASMVYGASIFYEKISYPASIQVRGWTSTILSILFLGGLCAFLLSVILEYITNLLLHSHGKPAFYVVDRSSDALIRNYFESEKKKGVCIKSL